MRTIPKTIGPTKGFDQSIELKITELGTREAREGLGRLGQILSASNILSDLSLARITMILCMNMHTEHFTWLVSAFEAKTEIVATLKNNEGQEIRVPGGKFSVDSKFPGAAGLIAMTEWFVACVDLNFADFLSEVASMLGAQMAEWIRRKAEADGTSTPASTGTSGESSSPPG